jgi:hypothetical protein
MVLVLTYDASAGVCGPSVEPQTRIVRVLAQLKYAFLYVPLIVRVS